MNRKCIEVGRREQDIDVPAAQGAHESRGDAGSKKRGVVDGIRDFQQQIDVTATRGIVQPRTEKTDDAVGTGFFAGDAANRIDLFCCQAHGKVLRCTKWPQCSTAKRNRNHPESHPSHRVIGADFRGRELAQLPLPFRPDLILPVPLAPARLAGRGFNQTLELARPLARLLGVPLEIGHVRRRRDTAPQASLPKRERKQNIRHAFECEIDLTGKSVLVVDDVMTTGATLDELARTLTGQPCRKSARRGAGGKLCAGASAEGLNGDSTISPTLPMP